jgi:uncharacterized protein YecA (UPF0149 family)
VGYKHFFTHARPYLRQLAALRRAGQPPQQLMQMLRAAEVPKRNTVGRNDPCPCGSGRKFKRCCLQA